MSGHLAFERLVIRRMPGFPSGGITLDELSPGVNIVYGPNASGKTTTARALQAALWPRTAPDRASILASFRLGAEEWLVDVDAGHARYQRDGRDAHEPALPVADSRDRYVLSLHELIGAEDRELAAIIARESAGGYDLAAAANALKFNTPSARTARTESQALETARQQYRKAIEKQKALHAEEEKLSRLRSKRDRANEAAARVRLLQLVLRSKAAESEEREARAALGAFPEGMARLHGDEHERLRALRDKLDEALRRLDHGRRDRENALRALAETGLPPEGLPDTLLPSLRARLDELKAAERDAADALRDLEAARRTLEEERRALTGALEDERLASIDAPGMEVLDAFAREAARVEARVVALEAELRALGDEEPPANLDALRRGADLLARWLAVDPERIAERRRLRTAAMLGAVLAAAGVVALGVFVKPALFALLVFPVAFLLWALRGRPETDPHSAIRRQFEALGIPGPASWAEDAIQQHRTTLDRLIAEGRTAEVRAERRRRLQAELEELGPERERIERQRTELVERFGIAPHTRHAPILWLAQRIGRWQDAARRVGEAEVALTQARARVQGALEAAAPALRPYALDPEAGVAHPAADHSSDDAPDRRVWTITDSATLSGAIEALDARRQAHVNAAHALRTANDAIVQAEREIAAIRKEREEIFARLGLNPDQDAVVEAWCRDREAYLEARARLDAARRDAEAAERELLEHPGYEPGLVARSREDLEAELAAEEQLLGERDGILQEISAIEARLEDARDGNDVELALAAVARAEADLRDARERDLLAALGRTLTEFVQAAARDRDRPRVFFRARELFAHFSRGRYILEFDDGDPPRFRARDTVTGIGHALDELSSATRVQLLLAVRVAFVETFEQGVHLPLILDEALGNSDDIRARAIIQVAADLAASGRQLFYFTAQADEVAKWRELLEERPGLGYRILDLAALRDLPGEERLADVASTPPPAPPPPDGMDHAAYGRALRVPPLDIRTATVGGTHLWYLIDDCEALHTLLNMQIRTWGELEALYETAQGSLGIIGRPVVERARAAARALREILELRRTGMGKPVDRQALIDSGAVTDAFLDRATELCRELDGDAARLLEALEAGRLERFRKANIARLREFFEEHGYLAPVPPLEPAVIRARAIAAATPDLEAGRLDPTTFERLLRAAGIHASVADGPATGL